MRPVTLSIEGLRSFRSEQTIDFTGRDHIAIIGDTGAGKSSILEALTFALYGRTTFSGRGNQELMGATSQQLRVVLAFDVGDQHWQVSRTLKRKRDGGVGNALVELRRIGDDGEPIEAYGSVRDVNEKIVEVLGLDDDAFLRTVVLPQGQFARLLVDDDQNMRTLVLRQIWRTDELEAVGRAAAEAAAESRELLARVAGFLEHEPTDPDAHLALLEAEAARAASRAEAAAERNEMVRRCVDTVAESAATVETAAKIASTLGSFDADAVRAEAGVIVLAATGIAESRAELTTRQQQARVALDAVPSDTDGLDLASVVAHDATLEGMPGLAESLAAAAGELATAASEVAAAQAALDAAADDLQRAEAAVVEAESQRVELSAARDRTRGAVDTQRQLLGAARTAADALAAAEEQVATSVDELAAADAAATASGTGVDARRAEVEAAERAVAAARRDAAAAAAAHGLHAGDDCPVCDRALPEGWAAPAAPELDDAEARRSAAVWALREVELTARRADAARAAAEERHRATTAVVGTTRAALDTAVDELRAAVSSDRPADLTRTDDELLATALASHDEASAALDAHDEVIAGLRARDRDARSAHGSATSQLDGASRRQTEADRRHQAAHDALRAAAHRLPADLAPALDGDIASEVSVARERLAERRRIVEARADQRRALQDELRELQIQQVALDERSRADIDQPLAALWVALAEHARQIGRADDRLGHEPTLAAFPPTCPEPAELQALLHLVASATTTVLVANEAAARSAATAAEGARAELADAATELGVAADDPRIADAAREVADDARVAAKRAAEDAAAFATRVRSVASLREAEAQLRAAHLAVDDLALALKDGAFPKWLTLRRSRRLLVHASRLLGEMTAGRYAFADLADDASPWAIFDHDSGQARSPASLSGGEKFVASLALSLGMVEMVGRVGGTVESLFLDEGFGALDRTNLDAAVEALGTVAASGRMVAVISHVRAVAEQVDHVLSVTREPCGSRVHWLDGLERSALVDDDLSDDPATAGLLE